MCRLRRSVAALALLALTAFVVGCGDVSDGAPPLSAAAQRAQRNVIAICGAANEAAANAAGGGAALENDVQVLIAEAKKAKDDAIVGRADAAFRATDAKKPCAPTYADTIDVAMLPLMPESKVQGAGVSSGLPIFRAGARSFYATHFGKGETTAQVECVTTSGNLYEHERELENFLYLLDVGNKQAWRLLGHLRQDCRRQGL